MRNLFIFTFISFLFVSITTTAFEDDKKNNNINIISGNEAVLTAGIPFFFFLNLDILYVFIDVKR